MKNSRVGRKTPKETNKNTFCENALFFKNILLYSMAWIRQIKCIVIMTKGSTKIENIMPFRAGVLLLGRGEGGQEGEGHTFAYFYGVYQYTEH